MGLLYYKERLDEKGTERYQTRTLELVQAIERVLTMVKSAYMIAKVFICKSRGLLHEHIFL